MKYKDLADGEYFVSEANPSQIYEKLNDTHAFPVPASTTLELGRAMVHVDPDYEHILHVTSIQPPPEPAEPK